MTKWYECELGGRIIHYLKLASLKLNIIFSLLKVIKILCKFAKYFNVDHSFSQCELFMQFQCQSGRDYICFLEKFQDILTRILFNVNIVRMINYVNNIRATHSTVFCKYFCKSWQI